MPAGTIALTINSKTVTGSGTAFTTELKVNDFVVAVVGGVTYTLGVAAIASNTSLTLNTAFDGPTASGLAWTAIPNQSMVGITAQMASDTARAIRAYNYDKANWQQVYTSSGTITVTLPDGSSYTGPSWNNIATTLTGKADKSSIGTIASQSASAVAITGGNIRNVTIQASSASFDNLSVNTDAAATALRANIKVPTGVDKQMITAWVTFTVNQTTFAVTVLNSFNVSSVARGGFGFYWINFATVMSNTNYGFTGTVRSTSAAEVPHTLYASVSDTKNAGQIVIRAAYATATGAGPFDPAEVTIVFMGGR